MNKGPPDGQVFSEVELLLAEKQVSLLVAHWHRHFFNPDLDHQHFGGDFSVLRTVQSHRAAGVLMLSNAGLTLLGIYMVVRAMKNIRRFDSHIRLLKQKHSVLAEYIA